ncbi:MAG: FtsH protease activity modulator HflK [Gammaproteobacteria bacterium]|nr:FtsH protease activity modulator HflK [Gammaproteobacteria bacterium]
MPWNQPGSGNDKDPWGQNRGNQGPPDLDELVKNFQNKLAAIFGGKSGGNGSDEPSGGSGRPGARRGAIVLIGAVLLAIWIWTGVYTVDQGENGVELRFGKYSETTQAGLHVHLPVPIETHEIINVQKVNTVEVGYRSRDGQQKSTFGKEALMLTKDENIIDIQFAVQYDVKDPTDLMFQVSDPADLVVRQATESAVREIVGNSSMDFAITEGRAEIAQATRELVQQILDRYRTGINIRTVEMQNAQPPAQVKPAFDDAVKAREDEERLKNEAEAYANDIIPRAEGLAARVLQEAEGYQASTIAKATGESSRFNQVLTEYEKAPGVTRDRLYIESLEDVLSKANKVLIDQKGGNNILYLPLDQMIKQGRSSSQLRAPTGSPSVSDLGIGDDSNRVGRTSRSGRSE